MAPITSAMMISGSPQVVAMTSLSIFCAVVKTVVAAVQMLVQLAARRNTPNAAPRPRTMGPTRSILFASQEIASSTGSRA